MSTLNRAPKDAMRALTLIYGNQGYVNLPGPHAIRRRAWHKQQRQMVKHHRQTRRNRGQ